MTSNKLSQSEYDRRAIVAQHYAANDDLVICRYCGPDCECVVDPTLPTDEQLIAAMQPDDIGKSNQRESDYWRRVGGHDEVSALGEE